MKNNKIEVFVQNKKKYQLVNTNLQDFLIFSLKKPMSFHSSQICLDDYQTFLIAKSFQKHQVEQHLGFVKLKAGEKQNNSNNTQQGFMRSESYYSTFLRHINLLYCQRLSQLFQILNIKNQFPLSNEWLLLYQVHHFKIQQNSVLKLIIQPPIYGKQVQVRHFLDEDNNFNSISISQISNLFRRENQNFYFISQPIQKNCMKNLDIIYSMRDNQIYGLVIEFNELFLCFPFHNVLFEKCCQVKIAKEIMINLQHTCYVQYFGSYCSGIYLQRNTIISTRHLLPISDQKLGATIFVRLFPYNRLIQGVISKIGTDNLDVIQIQLIQKQLDFVFNKRAAKQKILQKHHLIFEQFNQFDNQSYKKQNTQYLKTQKIQNKGFQIGSAISAFGFGKYSYTNTIFNKFEIILPTISTGIISKLIVVKNQLVFIKTDAKLYNGFSGSGLWQGDSLKGMAVFILKNKNNQSHYNRHNFSYSINFIERLRKTEIAKITYQNNKQLEEFDKIQTRKKFKLNKMIKAKL